MMSATELQSKPKYFSIDQANAALPLVRRVVEDVVRQYHTVVELHQQQQSLAADNNPGQWDTLEINRQEATTRLNELIEELNDIGVELKDWEKGLIDFLSRKDGRDVYLCWKLGEERIMYWHDLHAGFSGRQIL
ncbi:MAG: hypothetical protein HJJLKODD_00362 [Phycisphaerae bacterium]|nr:hypothetical protein [Phycisphaerae bacterium]